MHSGYSSFYLSCFLNIILWKFYIIHPNPTHLPVPSYLPLTLKHHPKKSLTKLIKNKKTHLIPPPFLPLQHLFIYPSGPGCCHTVYPFVQSAPPTSVHDNESLVWLLIRHKQDTYTTLSTKA